MSDITRILDSIAQGDPQAAAQLLPLVYDELRKLAAQKMSHEKPGQTLDATALVHEAYLRLVKPPTADAASTPLFANRGHFFAAAAEAMRRILVENARRRGRLKRGGGERQRIDLENLEVASAEGSDDLLALDEALTKLGEADPAAAALVQLRYFAGLTTPQASEVLGISLRSAERLWTYARAWLRAALAPEK